MWMRKINEWWAWYFFKTKICEKIYIKDMKCASQLYASHFHVIVFDELFLFTAVWKLPVIHVKLDKSFRRFFLNIRLKETARFTVLKNYLKKLKFQPNY